MSPSFFWPLIFHALIFLYIFGACFLYFFKYLNIYVIAQGCQAAQERASGPQGEWAPGRAGPRGNPGATRLCGLCINWERWDVVFAELPLDVEIAQSVTLLGIGVHGIVHMTEASVHHSPVSVMFQHRKELFSVDGFFVSIFLKPFCADLC